MTELVPTPIITAQVPVTMDDIKVCMARFCDKVGVAHIPTQTCASCSILVTPASSCLVSWPNTSMQKLLKKNNSNGNSIYYMYVHVCV